jgi:hypothetical protein
MTSIRFESPDVLWFLWLALVPLILHFISVKRHKKVYFSNVDLLKEIKKETTSVRRLKDWLQLIIRMLLVSFIVILFARPFFSEKQELNDQATVMFLDNSMSMSRSNGSVTLLEESKRKAIAYLQKMDFSSKLYIMNSSGDWSLNKMFYRDEAIQKVSSIKLNENSRSFTAYKKKIEELKKVTGFNFIVFSDLQSSAFDLDKILTDSLNSFQFYQEVGESKCNVYIDSLWITSTSDDDVQQIEYSLNTECKDANVTVEVRELDRVLAVSNLELNESLSGTIDLNLETNKVHLLSLNISDEVAYYDNDLSFVIDLRESKSILNYIGDEVDKDLLRLQKLVGDKSVSVVNQHELEIQQVKQSNMLVWSLSDVNQNNAYMLIDYVEDGGVLLVHPSEITDVDNMSLLGDYFEYEVGENGSVQAFNQHPFFSGAFEKQKQSQKWIENVVSDYAYLKNHDWEDLIGFENKAPLLVRKHRGKGMIYLFTCSIKEVKNFSLYPLILLKIIESSGVDQLLYNQKGNSESIAIKKGDRRLVFLQDSSQVKHNSYKVNIDDAIVKTGFMYTISNDVDTVYYAVNASKKESVFDFYESDDFALSHITFIDGVNDTQASISEEESCLDTYILLIIISLAVMEMTFFALKK